MGMCLICPLLTKLILSHFHATKPAQECDKEIKVSTWPQIAPDPNLIELHGTFKLLSLTSVSRDVLMFQMRGADVGQWV